MTMPKRIDLSQEKLHRVKTRTGDPQSGYLEEKLAGSRYVNIIEEDGASGKRLRIELDGASVSAEISDHKVKTDNADTAEYLENKITAGDNIVLSKETSDGKKNIKISALIPDAVNLKNVVYVDPSLSDNIAGLAYKTYAAAISWIITQSPSASNRFVVIFAGGEFSENFGMKDYVDIVGNNTVLTDKVHGSVSGFSTMYGCTITKIGVNRPNFKNCTISIKNSHIGAINAFDCVFDDCNLSGWTVNRINAFNCVFKSGYYRNVKAEFCKFEDVSIWNIDADDCKFRHYALTIGGKCIINNSILGRGQYKSIEFTESGTKEFLVFDSTIGWGSNEFFIIYCDEGDYCSLLSCTCNAIGLDKTTQTEGTLETQDCILNARYPIPNNVAGEWNSSYSVGDIERINRGAFVHSYIANLINASEKCIAIEIQEADLTQGNIIKASKKLPANCVITKVMCVGDMEFGGAGALNVGVVNADGDRGAVIGSIDFIKSYALYTERDPYLRYKAVANFTLELPQSQLNPVEPITAGSEINVVVELNGGTATGSCIIYIFYCVPMG